MMKLILILGVLVATAHCGTEHRRAARAETARSEKMSREAGVVDSDSARQRDLETLESGNGKTRESTGVDSNSTRQSSWNYPQACTENSEASVANKKATLEAFRLYSGRGDISKHAKTTAASGTRMVIMITEGSSWSWYGSAGVECINYRGWDLFFIS